MMAKRYRVVDPCEERMPVRKLNNLLMLKVIEDASVMHLLILALAMKHNAIVVHRVAQVSEQIQNCPVISRKLEL